MTGNRNDFVQYFEVIQNGNGGAAYHPHCCEGLLTTLMAEPGHVLGCGNNASLLALMNWL